MKTTNAYYEVTASGLAYIRAGAAESNTYIGSSMALNPVYVAIRLQIGDQVHDLIGGTFFVLNRQKQAWAGRINRPHSPHVFLKYTSRTPDLCRDQLPPFLREIPKDAARRLQDGYGAEIAATLPMHAVTSFPGGDEIDRSMTFPTLTAARKAVPALRTRLVLPSTTIPF